MRTGRAVALLAVAVVVAVLLLRHVGSTTTVAATGPTATSAPTTAAPVPASSTTTSTTLPAVPPAQVKLLVLNGTGAGNLAGATSRRLAASPGYDTLAADNTTATVTTSAIYAVTPQYLGAAQALAATVHLPASAVQSALPASAPVRTSERSIADVVLVIGPDFPSTGSSASSSPSTTAGG